MRLAEFRRDKKDNPRASASVLAKNYKALLPLLDVEEPFRFGDVETVSKDLWSKLASVGIIRKTDDYTNVNRERVLDADARTRLEQYRVRKASYTEGTLVCPHCGNHGFQNLPGADYQCTDPRCKREFATFHEVGSA